MTNTQFQKLDEIKLIPVPASVDNNRGYQAVPHIDVINNIKETLDKKGLGVTREVYKTSKSGNLIYGSILTDMKSDNDLGGAIHFVNSYDKSKKLEVSGGACVFLCDNGMIRMHEFTNNSRKHVGSINIDLTGIISNAVEMIEVEYNYFIEAKEFLKNREMSNEARAGLAGVLFMQQQILSVTQLSAFKQECERKGNVFNDGSAWGVYNNFTQALKLSHPADYIKNHCDLHESIMHLY